MIYVDEAILLYKGELYCHMMTDGELKELHVFANRLGLKRGYAFQDRPFTPHYDLSPRKRAKAVELGAIEVTSVEMVKRCRMSVEQRHQKTATLMG